MVRPHSTHGQSSAQHATDGSLPHAHRPLGTAGWLPQLRGGEIAEVVGTDSYANGCMLLSL
eukprot:1205892-Rhodomonas_salina.1